MGKPDHKAQQHGPRGRLQLYVDDPVIAVAGSPADVAVLFDVILVWWMLLGIPHVLAQGILTDVRIDFLALH